MVDGVTEHCPICGAILGLSQLEGPANDPASLCSQVENLQQRLDEIERGNIDAAQVQQQMAQMCPMCRGMLGGLSGTADRSELEWRIQEEIQRLEERAATLERSGRWRW